MFYTNNNSANKEDFGKTIKNKKIAIIILNDVLIPYSQFQIHKTKSQILMSSLHSGNACESLVACDYKLFPET